MPVSISSLTLYEIRTVAVEPSRWKFWKLFSTWRLTRGGYAIKAPCLSHVWCSATVVVLLPVPDDGVVGAAVLRLLGGRLLEAELLEGAPAHRIVQSGSTGRLLRRQILRAMTAHEERFSIKQRATRRAEPEGTPRVTP